MLRFVRANNDYSDILSVCPTFPYFPQACPVSPVLSRPESNFSSATPRLPTRLSILEVENKLAIGEGLCRRNSFAA
jgi:hypothetical protein